VQGPSTPSRQLQFTRNNYRAKRLNGSTAMVVAIDPQGSSVVVEQDDGERQKLDLAHLADRHIRPGWVRTIHSAQGATADRVMAHLESFRANTVDTRAAYVAISRAGTGASVYTDSRPRLLDVLGLRDGAQAGAIDETMGKSLCRDWGLSEVSPIKRHYLTSLNRHFASSHKPSSLIALKKGTADL
jgi:hypothetical protein